MTHAKLQPLSKSESVNSGYFSGKKTLIRCQEEKEKCFLVSGKHSVLVLNQTE